MKKTLMFIMALFSIPTTPLLSMAAEFDGSKPLLCTVINVTECIMGQGCKEVTAEEINLPRYLWIDVSKKTIQIDILPALRCAKERGFPRIALIAHS